VNSTVFAGRHDLSLSNPDGAENGDTASPPGVDGRRPRPLGRGGRQPRPPCERS